MCEDCHSINVSMPVKEGGSHLMLILFSLLNKWIFASIWQYFMFQFKTQAPTPGPWNEKLTNYRIHWNRTEKTMCEKNCVCVCLRMPKSILSKNRDLPALNLMIFWCVRAGGIFIRFFSRKKILFTPLICKVVQNTHMPQMDTLRIGFKTHQHVSRRRRHHFSYGFRLK